MKKYLSVMLFLLFSVFLNAENQESFNRFSKFTFRMSITPRDYSYVIISGNEDKYDSQLNVGNYLSFMPSRYASLNLFEFFSDILKKDYKIIEINKKGKVKELTEIIKYDKEDFFKNFQEGIIGNKAEVKGLGIVFAGVKVTDKNEYKITAYGNAGIGGSISGSSKGVSLANILFFPTNSAFYIKKISDTEIVWSPNKDYNNINYTFTVNNNKVTARKRNGKEYFTFYKDGNSLFLDYEKRNLEFRVNENLSQFEYYEKGKLKKVYKYQII